MPDKIKLMAPVPGRCPMCGGDHRKDEGHDECSAYYRMRYRRKHGCYPEEEKNRGERDHADVDSAQ